MAQLSVNTQRFDPYKILKLRVRWDGKYVAGVSKVASRKRTTNIVEYRDGSDPSSIRRLPSKAKYEAVALERGVIPGPEFE